MTTEVVNVKPFIVLLARLMPPGRRRLEMVRLAHGLDLDPEFADSNRRAT
jgi:hypothetical protein